MFTLVASLQAMWNASPFHKSAAHIDLTSFMMSVRLIHIVKVGQRSVPHERQQPRLHPIWGETMEMLKIYGLPGGRKHAKHRETPAGSSRT